MNENDWYEALGLTPPENEPTEAAEAEAEGENEQAVAEPEGGNEQEPAEPAEEDEESGAEESEPEGGNEQAVAEPAEQSKEERARRAAARRRAERDAAVEQARQEERASLDTELKELFDWAGFKNGDKPIETLEDLRRYRADAEAAQLQKDLKEGRLTPEALGQMVREEIRKQQPPPDQAAQAEAFQARVENELAEIRQYDPEIRSVADFRKLDRAEEFFRQVSEHGHSFAEAYRFVYADRIAEQNARKTAAAEVQRARNNARSKDHMRPVGAKGTGDVPIPSDVMRMYRSIMPNASEDTIRKHYQKYAKESA